MDAGHQVGDRLRLDLPPAAALPGRGAGRLGRQRRGRSGQNRTRHAGCDCRCGDGGLAGRVVQQHVSELVSEGLDGLGVVDVGPHGDGPLEVVRQPVRAAGAVPAPELEAAGPHLLGQRVPQALRGLAGQQHRPRAFGQRLAGGLRDVEDVNHLEPADRAAGPGRVPRRVALGTASAADRRAGAGVGSLTGRRRIDRAVIGVADLGPVDHRGQDGDALAAFVDLTAQRLPRAEPGDGGGVGALRGDEQHVVQAVVREGGGNLQPALPVLAVADRPDLLGQRGVQLFELGGPSCLSFGGLGRAGGRLVPAHHAPPGPACAAGRDG